MIMPEPSKHGQAEVLEPHRGQPCKNSASSAGDLKAFTPNDVSWLLLNSVQPTTPNRSTLSRLLSQLDRIASRPLIALALLAADLAWIVYSVGAGFPSRPETVFQTVVAALTFAMVFVIQHTQSREQAATQRKLDEILHALPGADNALLSLEHASDHDLRSVGETHRAIRDAALDDAE